MHCPLCHRVRIANAPFCAACGWVLLEPPDAAAPVWEYKDLVIAVDFASLPSGYVEPAVTERYVATVTERLLEAAAEGWRAAQPIGWGSTAKAFRFRGTGTTEAPTGDDRTKLFESVTIRVKRPA